MLSAPLHIPFARVSGEKKRSQYSDESLVGDTNVRRRVVSSGIHCDELCVCRCAGSGQSSSENTVYTEGDGNSVIVDRVELRSVSTKREQGVRLMGGGCGFEQGGSKGEAGRDLKSGCSSSGGGGGIVATLFTGPSRLFFSSRSWIFASGIASSAGSAVKPELAIRSSGPLIVRVVGNEPRGRGSRGKGFIIEVSVELEEIRWMGRDIRLVVLFVRRLKHIRRQINAASAPVGPKTAPAMAPLLNDGGLKGVGVGFEKLVGAVIPPE